MIALGDVADGWPETKSCIDELLKIKHLTFILGNHDFWTLEWMDTNFFDDVWFEQGGKATIESYRDGIPESHIQFLKSAKYYFEFEDKLFVHAGINPLTPLASNTFHTFLWDRNLARTALDLHSKNIFGKLTEFEAVYIGHTPIPYDKPLKANDVWLMDTGAGWSGVLSMMNIDTEEIFTSDAVPLLYPGIEGRKRK